MASLQGTTVNNYLRTLEQVRAMGWYGTPTGTSYTALGAELGVASGEGYLLCYNRDAGAYGVLNIAGSASNLKISGGTINVSTGALQQGGNQVLHAGNVATYALPIGGGTLTGGLTVTNLFGNANSASLYANNSSNGYGSWKVGGTRNGWYGIEFESGSNLMMNSNEVGFHRNGYGWQLWWSAGTAYCHKGNPGAGTQATILDSSNVATYALPIGGGTLTGAVSIIGQTVSGQSHYQWDGGTYRNPGDWTATLIARRDNSTVGINGSIPSLVLYNNNGGDQTTVGLSFASAEGATGQGNAVALAGIVARKEGAGTVGGWSSGSLNFYVKNVGARVDALNISSTGTANFPIGLQQNGSAVLTAASTSAPSLSIGGSAGSVAWTNVSGRPTAVSSFTKSAVCITATWAVVKAAT